MPPAIKRTSLFLKPSPIASIVGVGAAVRGSNSKESIMDKTIFKGADGTADHYRMYSSIGSYTLVYLADGDCVCCGFCALENHREGEDTEYEVHPLFEGRLYCEECGTDLIGSYEDDD